MAHELNTRLFVTAGIPLAFDLSLLPKAEKESIEPVIKKRGGLVDPNTGQFTCVLAPKSGHNAPENSVLQEYVFECVRRNRLVDMSEYRPRSAPMQLHSASHDQSSIAGSKSARKKPKSNLSVSRSNVEETKSSGGRNSRKGATSRKNNTGERKQTTRSSSVGAESESESDIFTEGTRRRRKTGRTTQTTKKASSEEEGPESESEEEPATPKIANQQKTKAHGKKAKPPLRAPYTEEDDQRIVDSIVAYHKKGGSYSLCGDKLYHYVQKSIPHRSWQSIKERVKRHIRDRVDKALRAVEKGEKMPATTRKPSPTPPKESSSRGRNERCGSDQSDDEGSEGGDEASDADSGDKRSERRTPSKKNESHQDEGDEPWVECAECSTDKQEGGVPCDYCCLMYHVGCVDAPKIIPHPWVCPRCVSHRQAPGATGPRRLENRQTSSRADARDELPYAAREEAPELDLFGDEDQSRARPSRQARATKALPTEKQNGHTRRPHELNTEEERNEQPRKKKRTETTENEVRDAQKRKRKTTRVYSSDETETERGRGRENAKGKERENEGEVEEEGRQVAPEGEHQKFDAREAQREALDGEDVGRERRAKRQRRKERAGDGELEEIDRMLLQAAGVPPRGAPQAAPTSPTQTQHEPSQFPADHASPPPFATQMETDDTAALSDAAALAAFIQSVSATLHLPRANVIKALYWSSGSPKACLAALQGTDAAGVWDAEADRQLLEAEVPPSDLVEKFGQGGINKRIVFLES